MKHIIVHYDLIEKMILESKEKDIQISETERDIRLLEQRLEDEEAAHAALKEKYGQGR